MTTIFNNTKFDYYQKVNNVIDYIDNNLGEDLSLRVLSSMAFLSPFHFHRIFLELVGETLNTFVNRKRIERIASILLVGTDKPLNDLAYSYGFSCGNSFARAFKKYYELTPSEYKREFSKIGVEVLPHEKYLWLLNEIKNKKNGK